MIEEPAEVWFCKEHNEVVYQIEINGETIGMQCDQGWPASE